MLKITKLNKSFADLLIMNRFDLSVPPNGFTVMIGPSGCGKSTFFDLLTGVVEKDGGDIFWHGKTISHLGGMAAYMQQKDMLLPWLSLMDNALLPAKIAGINPQTSMERGRELFSRLELSGFEKYLPAAVSGGMRQRCALVRTLMFGRELVLLDEPFSSLDAITRRSMQRLFLMLQRDFQKTILMITHDIDEALLLADEMLVLTRRPMRISEHFFIRIPKSERKGNPRVAEMREHVMDLLESESNYEGC